MPDPLIESALLRSVPGLRHGFVSNHTADGRTALAEVDARVATAKQVHGATLIWVNSYEKRQRDADAVATGQSGLPVGVYSADCTPILMAALDGHGRPRAVMAVHGGWRGTAQGIAGLSFASLAQALGPGHSYVAAIGPCISFDSFEVGQEVVDAFPGILERGLARFLRQEEGRAKYLVNLPGENARQLQETALQHKLSLRLEALPICTLKETARLPSYRRDREKAGRLLSYLSFESS